MGIEVLTSDDDRRWFRDGTIAATVAIIDDTEMLHDSDAWYRHTQDEVQSLRDGVTLDAQALSHWLGGLGKMSGRPSAREGAEYWLDNTRDIHTVDVELEVPWERRGSKRSVMGSWRSSSPSWFSNSKCHTTPRSRA